MCAIGLLESAIERALLSAVARVVTASGPHPSTGYAVGGEFLTLELRNPVGSLLRTRA